MKQKIQEIHGRIEKPKNYLDPEMQNFLLEEEKKEDIKIDRKFDMEYRGTS